MDQKTTNVSIDDTVLVQHCRRGDAAAMERLILKYQNRIFNVILKICPNIDDAAELTQETFVKIIENIDKFEERSSFYTWAFRIAVNLTLNFRKRKVKLGFNRLDADNNEQQQGTAIALKEILVNNNAPDPAVIAENKELCELLTSSLIKLDDNQRAVIVLRDIEGMSYNDIANVLGLELGTVKSRISRARSNLREILEALL